MDTQKPTLTVTQALAEGYTHFAMGPEDEFYVYPLSAEELEKRIKKDAEMWEDKSINIPRLCSKEVVSPSIAPDDLSRLLSERFEVDDQYAPGSIESLAQNIHTEENFIKATEALNKCLAEYRTFSDTDILVTLD